LHEEVAQNLTALGLNLATVEELGTRKQSSKKILTECRSLAEKTLREVRTLSYLLHPPILGALGLPGALRDYAAGFSRRSGVAIELSVPEDFERPPAEVETALFRVAQESLTNVQRHSGSSKARVELRRDEKEIVLEILDFGTGIPPERLNGSVTSSGLGVGIVGMREWMSQLGGRLAIDGGKNGTRITAVVAHEAEIVARAPA
jgi:signal transduction histidine kinase